MKVYTQSTVYNNTTFFLLLQSCDVIGDTDVDAFSFVAMRF